MLVTLDTLTHGGTDGDSDVYNIIIMYTHNIMCIISVCVCTCRTEQVTIMHSHAYYTNAKYTLLYIIIIIYMYKHNIIYFFMHYFKTSAPVCHCRNSVLEL